MPPGPGGTPFSRKTRPQTRSKAEYPGAHGPQVEAAAAAPNVAQWGLSRGRQRLSGTQTFSGRAADWRELFPQGTQVVAGDRARGHHRNADTQKDIPPRQGVADGWPSGLSRPPRRVCLAHPAGVPPFRGRVFRWCRSARPPAILWDASGIRARRARQATANPGDSQPRRQPTPATLNPGESSHPLSNAHGSGTLTASPSRVPPLRICVLCAICG
jgi:hypothetical protein